MYFFNATTIEKMDCKHNIIYPENEPDGVPDAQVSYRMKATFKASMRLHDFPFDHQVKSSTTLVWIPFLKP